MQKKTDFQFHVKETNDTIYASFGAHVFEGLSMMEKMTSISLLKSNNTIEGKYMVLDDETNNYWNDNVKEYKANLKEQRQMFQDFRSMIFDEVRGPLYVYPERVVEIVKTVYSYQYAFNTIEEFHLPQIQSRVVFDDDKNQKVFDVKNIDIFDEFDKGVVISWAASVASNLDYQLAQSKGENSVKKVHGVSKTIMRYTYDESSPNKRRFAESFPNKDYCIQHLMHQGLQKQKSIEDSFMMIFNIDEAIKYKMYQEKRNNPEPDIEGKKGFKIR